MKNLAPGLGLVLLISMLGCGDDGDGGAESDGSPTDGDASPDDGGNGPDGGPGGGDGGSEFAVQIIRPSCGPTDGPAVRILLGSENEDVACAVQELTPSVDLQVWVDPEAIQPVTYSFAPGEAMGSGAVCPGGDTPCRPFESGSIHFETYRNGVSATGSYILIGEGSDVNGSFDATWCMPDPPEPCG